MKQHNDIIIVTGVSASGKDYLLTRTLEEMSQGDTITLFSFGAEILALMRVAPEECDSRDELRNISAQNVRRFARKVIERVLMTDGTKILNTHVAYRQGTLIVTDPVTDLEIMARDYIVVTADPETIIKRRQEDHSRSRVLESANLVSIHQDIVLAAVRTVAKVTGARITVLDNQLHNTTENVEQLRQVIKGGLIKF